MDTENQLWVFSVTPSRVRLERNANGKNTLVVVGSGLAYAPDAWTENISGVQFIDDETDVEKRNLRELFVPKESSGFARTFDGRQKEIVK